MGGAGPMDRLRCRSEMGVAMTTPTGKALEMRLELSALAQRHGLRQVPHFVPLLPAPGCAQLVEGFASTGDLDYDRCKFSPFAFGLVRLAREAVVQA
jgi:hypothetical protein